MIDNGIGPWIIELTNAQFKTPIRLKITEPMTFGRIVAGDSKAPDVDLAPYNAESLGVSRLHFTIQPETDRLIITDLVSGNGTFLNGNRLKPEEGYRLSSGDQITAGLLSLDLNFVVTPTYGGLVHKQPSLQLRDLVKAGKGQLILIVAQDPELAGTLAEILGESGYTTRVCHEVVGAIRVYNQRRPSAILIDPILPDMSGLEFCRYIRRDVHVNTTPIVIVKTASRSVESVEAMQAGADVFLDRPVSARELRHVISSLIEQSESGQSGMYTKHLVGTAPLKAVQPETRKNTCVLFVAGHSDAPIVLTVQQPVSFGRAISTGTLKSHVDLTRYDAANWGVSRVHMALQYEDGRFWVEDQDSVNGTYINGDPIQPHQKVALQNADEIRLGQMRMYIYFLEDMPHMQSEAKAKSVPS
jgi:CheY-like chemotaxis protein/pSer/pThr/pTyr-binding forkhead associated (FHA) protein